MRRAFLLGLLVACSDPPTGEITARVTHYDYQLDIETRQAHADLTLAIDVGGNCVKIPFRGGGPTSVTIGGDAASGSVDGMTLEACGEGWEQGQAIHLTADVEIPLATLGPSQVGYSITKDNEGNQFYYLVSWLGGCDQFAPCDNRTDQFATYKFTVTHPANYKARCPGKITEKSPTETICDFDLEGGPTYSTFGVAAYPAWTETDKGSWGGVQVTLYDRASTKIDSQIDVAYHTGYLEWMQSQFGPYPFGSELRVLTAPTYWSGFEHPGNIVLDDSLAKVLRPRYWNETAHVLDHEIAHMWAGDQTTLKGTYDFVWKESMAEYLSYVYEDMVSPANGLITTQYWKAASDGAAYYPVPGEMPALFDYYGDVYGPGPMVLFHQLEVMTSREQVLAAIKTLLGKPHAIGVDDVLAALETSTGLDLDDYAAAWIRGTGAPNWPRYAMTYGSGMLTLTQTNKTTPARGCKFHVALKGANATDVQLVEIDTRTNVDQTIAVTPTFTVTALDLDPMAECLVFKQSSSPRTLPADRPHPWVTHR
jgi:aminopeptidase N